MRAFLLPLVLLLGASPAYGAPGQDDCWSGADAPTDHANAPVLPLPTHCVGAFDASDETDSYRVFLTGTQDLRIAVDGVFLIEICISLPGSPGVVDCYPFDRGEFVLEDAVAGEYGIIIESGGSVGSYELAMDTQTSTFTGRVLVGAASSQVSLNERVGPGQEQVDGAWIELPLVGTGNETIELVYYSPTAHWVDLVLYDAASTHLPAEGCKSGHTSIGFATGVMSTSCGLPRDATWAFVRVNVGLQIDYVVELHF